MRVCPVHQLLNTIFDIIKQELLRKPSKYGDDDDDDDDMSSCFDTVQFRMERQTDRITIAYIPRYAWRAIKITIHLNNFPRHYFCRRAFITMVACLLHSILSSLRISQTVYVFTAAEKQDHRK